MTTIRRAPPIVVRNHGIEVQCADCGYSWTSYGKGRYHRCPQCFEKRTGRPWPGRGAPRDEKGRVISKAATTGGHGPAGDPPAPPQPPRVETPAPPRGLFERPITELFK